MSPTARKKAARDKPEVPPEDIAVSSEPPKKEPDLPQGDEHPLTSRTYTCPTLDIERLGQTLRLWQRAGLNGGVLLGPTRIGKTNAVDDCIKHIKDIMTVPCFATRINWRLNRQPTERAFYRRLLEGLQYSLIERRRTEDLEKCLINRIATLAHDAGGRRFVVFIDDAHNVMPAEFQWLCHIFNELYDQNVALMVLLVGQPEMGGHRVLLREGGDTQVIGRFMRSEFVFQGVANGVELRSLLKWIDDDSEYPPGSGLSYLAPFLPRALKSGFRLDQLAGRIWSAYLEWRPRHKADEHAGMGKGMTMETFSGTVTTLVQELAERDSPDLTVEEEMIKAVMRLTTAQHG